MPLDSGKVLAEQRIVSGDETKHYVGRYNTMHYARILTESIHDTAPVVLSRTRESIRALINVPILAYTRSYFALDRLYPYPSNTEAMIGIYEDIRAMLKDRGLLGVIIEEKLAGIGGFMEVAKTDDKRPVIELRRMVLDKDYRGQNRYPALADECVKQAEGRNPETLIVASRQPSVIQWSKDRAFSEIDWHQFYVGHKRTAFNARQEQSFADRVRRFGWRYFERAPRAPPAS